MELSRKRKTLDPCETCRLHRERCICAQIPKLDLKARVCLIIHAKELKRTTNTGSLALHALTNSEMFVRGRKDDQLNLTDSLSSQYESYVLFPSDDAVPIETIRPTKPVQLFVSDGNWRQASKVNQRQPELSHLPRVKIQGRQLSSHHLRKEHFADGLSTIEAIAHALGAIEGLNVSEELMKLYQAKLRATLIGRGIKDL